MITSAPGSLIKALKLTSVVYPKTNERWDKKKTESLDEKFFLKNTTNKNKGLCSDSKFSCPLKAFLTRRSEIFHSADQGTPLLVPFLRMAAILNSDEPLIGENGTDQQCIAHPGSDHMKPAVKGFESVGTAKARVSLSVAIRYRQISQRKRLVYDSEFQTYNSCCSLKVGWIWLNFCSFLLEKYVLPYYQTFSDLDHLFCFLR